MKKYSKEHQWVELSDEGIATIGISKYAVDELGEVNFVELPEVGAEIEGNGVLCVVESLKAAADLMSPAGGKVIEANQALAEEPSLLNEEPEGSGWICKLKDAKLVEGLMTAEEYKSFLNG